MSDGPGVRVLSSGIAVVHEGEQIVPAEGASARFGPPPASDIHYSFPVHVVVVGGLDDQASTAIQEDLLDKLYRALG
ncbi:hypothetical protein ASF98_21395 [Arthrobacter sp. Leaf337]|uniref:hypothetical protein n=1 Tax=Arthrobacter sp. Leaf337 TaxID=1736342 RepID=UPI0006F56740|nr:hypothetical protein [Arthrobacter sp. Leaf337]KQR77305.1 hypothetical protein ASF98_21395 [Arthrobacter sp. Leaf337]